MSHLNKYEAAALLRLSFELLEWFTHYAPKQGDSRKLVCTKDSFGITVYSRNDLTSWDTYLWEAWPASQRQPPAAIEREVLLESRGQCSFCTNSVVGEVSHIDPWETSHCHHPHNLIYLCPTCHTRTDRTKEIPKDVLKQRKQELLDRRCQDWRLAAKNHADLVNSPPPGSAHQAMETLLKINMSNAVMQKPVIGKQFAEATGFTDVRSIPPHQISEALKKFEIIYFDFFPTACGSLSAIDQSFHETKDWHIRCGNCGTLYRTGLRVPRSSLFGNKVSCPVCRRMNDASYFNVLDPQQ